MSVFILLAIVMTLALACGPSRQLRPSPEVTGSEFESAPGVEEVGLSEEQAEELVFSPEDVLSEVGHRIDMAEATYRAGQADYGIART